MSTRRSFPTAGAPFLTGLACAPGPVVESRRKPGPGCAACAIGSIDPALGIKPIAAAVPWISAGFL